MAENLLVYIETTAKSKHLRTSCLCALYRFSSVKYVKVLIYITSQQLQSGNVFNHTIDMVIAKMM